MLDKLKSLKYYLIVAVVAAGASWIICTNQKPTKIEYKRDESVVEELEQLRTKYSESIAQIQKMKSMQEKKSKVLITNVDGSSVLKEFSDTSSLETETQSLLQKNAEQETTIRSLQSKLAESYVEKNKKANVSPKYVYDSERGSEYEVSASYSFIGAGAGINPEKKAWRISIGPNFPF